MHDTIYRKDAVKAFLMYDGQWIPEVDCDNMPFEISVRQVKDILKTLPSTDDCTGCKHQGQWEDEYEMGYPSPCTGCRRRAKDNYEAISRKDKE